MGSGLSMTSVNKIKELAEAREYSLALEIIDSQDLTKSLNPQFVRLCGDVYIANKRYEDARRTLVMAHKMAPEAKRVIYSLVELYFRMGYKQLAEFYFNLYMFDAEPNLPQTNHMNYIYSKAQGCPLDEIETLLFPMYSDTMDYDWSFELYLLLKLQGRNSDAKAVAEDYCATYKNEPNVAIIEELEETQDSKAKLEKLFYVYAEEEVEDDLDVFEELRREEEVLMEADSLRMNPKEAEIQIMFDDNDKVTLGAKLRYKRHIKEQEKLAKKAQQEASEEDFETEESDEDVSNKNPDASDIDENSNQNVDDTEINDNEIDEEAISDNTEDKPNIFKKLFSKFKKDDGETEENIEDAQEPELSEGESIEETVTENAVAEDDAEDDVRQMEESEVVESEEDNATVEAEEIVEPEYEETVENELEQETEEAFTPTVGDSVMQEIYGKKKISIKSELGEDSFFNNSEEEFSEEIHDTSNPFDELYGSDKSEVDDAVSQTDTQDEPRASSFTFEEAQLEPEDSEELEVDDFSQESFDFDFDDSSYEAKEESEETEQTDVETEESESYDVIDEVETEEPEAYEVEADEVKTDSFEIDEDEAYESGVEADAEDDETAEELQFDDSEENTDIESEMLEADSDAVAEEAESVESDIYVEEEIQADEVYETQEATQQEGVETEFSYSEDLEIDEQEDAACETDITSSAVDSMKNESVYESIKKNNGFDYPEFKTTLFPEYGKEVVEVENNFNEIMTRAQDKINENLMKEEQMQREAEALLASLGIDIGSSGIKSKSETRMNVSSVATATNTSDKAVRETSDEKSISQEVPGHADEESDYSPSRDELKASLKIDSVKKSILKHIKEYR